MKNQYKLKPVALAVGLGLFVSAPAALAQQADEADVERESTIEEVVTTGSRLQGSAAAVVQERKNQAFVADILGAEQLSRSGDSDAASALRRVTGLTLVDGKFIYVRGLGERYSSARINGASIPSPDLTRNVIPLDIIPSTIIESMAVQKVFSPSMPAAFGGGNIDIRTRSLPDDFVFSLEAGVGMNSNADEGYTYNRDDSGIPAGIKDAIGRYQGDFSLRNIVNTDGLTGSGNSAGNQARAINASLAKQLPRDMVLKKESLDPNMDFKATLGNSFDESFFGGTIGVLAAASYDNDWDVSERKNAVISNNATADCSTSLATVEDISKSCYNTFEETT
ncbi:TonB-dependent receptor plug domain-containing protein, partial [Idiomarina sp. UBA3992]